MNALIFTIEVLALCASIWLHFKFKKGNKIERTTLVASYLLAIWEVNYCKEYIWVGISSLPFLWAAIYTLLIRKQEKAEQEEE